MWKRIFFISALCLGQAALAEEQEAAPDFFVSDNVFLHLEGTDADIVVLAKIANLLRHELELAVVAHDNAAQWPRDLVLKLDTKAAEPPYEALISIADLKGESDQQVFAYSASKALVFRSAIRDYFTQILDVGFASQHSGNSISNNVELHLKSTDQDLAILREMATLVRDVLAEATPSSAKFGKRRLEMKLDGGFVEPPYKAALSLADMDFPEDHHFQTVFFYDPAKRQAFKVGLREFLGRLLDVNFPMQAVQGVEKATPHGALGKSL